MYKPTVVQLGPIGRQPILFSVTKTTELQSSRLRGGIVPSTNVCSLQALEALSAKYVPRDSTAQLWVKRYEEYIQGKDSNEKFRDFTAGLHARSLLIPEDVNYLAISSINTYLRYITKDPRFRRHAHSKYSRAIAAKAGSLGSLQKSPRLTSEMVSMVVVFIREGSMETLKLRAGMWLQMSVGGRCIDVSRLRQNSLEWDAAGTNIRSVHWRWTKSIRQAQHAKVAPVAQAVLSVMGEPPFTSEVWNTWSREDTEGYPLSTYDSALVNIELGKILQDVDPVPTSTSLRDVFHGVLGELCDHDADEMVKFTPHRSAQSLRSNYMDQRPLCHIKKIAKKAGAKNSTKRKKVTTKRSRARRG